MKPAFLAVHVTPRSGRDEVLGVCDGAHGDEVYVRVCAPPDGGKANRAVCALVAGALGLPKRAVSVASGMTSRHKRLAVALDADRLAAWIDGLDRI